MKALQQCAKIGQSLQYNISPLSPLVYCIFIRQFAAATKYLKTNHTFFKQTFFINSRNKKINDKLFLAKLVLNILHKY